MRKSTGKVLEPHMKQGNGAGMQKINGIHTYTHVYSRKAKIAIAINCYQMKTIKKREVKKWEKEKASYHHKQ